MEPEPPCGGIRRIAYDDHRVVPWKNGGGTTREIAIGGATAEDGDWGWRISMAGVAQDGPFSVFPGIDRIIVVINGVGMDLVRQDGAVLPLEPFHPVSFPGDEPVEGRLRDGPIRDLNVMTRRGQYTASMEVVEGPVETKIETGPGEVLLVHVLAGTCRLHPEGGDPCDAAGSNTLLHDGQGACTLTSGEASRVAVIRVSAVCYLHSAL